MMSLLLGTVGSGLIVLGLGPSPATGSLPTSLATPVSAPMSLNGTTWEFEDNGRPTVITIDPSGSYIENRVSGRHVVHGDYQQVGGKDCFTSAMGERRTSCWTAVPQTTVGQLASATSDSGIVAVFKRVPYRRLKMP